MTAVEAPAAEKGSSWPSSAQLNYQRGLSTNDQYKGRTRLARMDRSHGQTSDEATTSMNIGDDDMGTPLAGVRVLDLTRLLPGNYCAWLLATLGAEVVKVEDPGAGDYMRTFGLQVSGQGAAHHVINRAKRSIVLDLKSPAGRDVFLRLVDTTDVVIESFRSGVMDRLNLGHGVLRQRRPSLVVASISGYGADGPLSGVVAHDLNALAFSGFLERIVGQGDGLPQALTIPIADVVGGGLVPALGITALVLRARLTGEGGWLDASLAEGFSLLPSVLLGDILAGVPIPPRGAAEFDGRPFYRVYALKDGMVAVGAIESPFWAALCDALGEQDLLEAQWDEARQEEAVARLTNRFASLTRAALEKILEGRDTCVNIVQTYSEMLASDHAVARDLSRPAVNVPMKVLAPPFRIDGKRPAETRGAPHHGEHTQEVLAESGFSEDEINALLESGAVVQGISAS